MHLEQAKPQRNLCSFASATVAQQLLYTVFSKLRSLLKQQLRLTNCNPVETDEAAAVLGGALSPAGSADAEGALFQFPAPFSEA